MNEIDLLLQNAQLRDELEPFMDESVFVIDLERLPTDQENAYLASLLAWERAPVLPIRDWFEPRLVLEHHELLNDQMVRERLEWLIERLHEKNIVLEMTEHLSDRQLYCLIARDILPAQEKRVGLAESVLRWQCLDPVSDEESWLRFYASDDERREWAEETGLRLPPKERLPFSRPKPR
ncbi:MAG: hypothetical protein ABL888_12530 [Pirellulaceae bacterium]|jgi:hypothetical protein